MTNEAKNQTTADTCQFSDHFVALDFETANRFRHSACAISIVTVKSGKVSDVYARLIRPLELQFEFSYIHGITAADVKNAPSFADMHAEITELLRDANRIVTHDASFDRSVMTAACNKWGL